VSSPSIHSWWTTYLHSFHFIPLKSSLYNTWVSFVKFFVEFELWKIELWSAGSDKVLQMIDLNTCQVVLRQKNAHPFVSSFICYCPLLFTHSHMHTHTHTYPLFIWFNSKVHLSIKCHGNHHVSDTHFNNMGHSQFLLPRITFPLYNLLQHSIIKQVLSYYFLVPQSIVCEYMKTIFSLVMTMEVSKYV
jgi:hypothetical protein